MIIIFCVWQNYTSFSTFIITSGHLTFVIEETLLSLCCVCEKVFSAITAVTSPLEARR